MSTGIEKAQASQAHQHTTYTPPKGKAWIYTIVSLSTGKSLYVGSTAQPLTKRFQHHLFAMKSGGKGAAAKLAKYFDPNYSLVFDAGQITPDGSTLLQVGNFLIIAHSCPVKDRFATESLLISKMSYLPCNTKDRGPASQLRDRVEIMLDNLGETVGPEYANLRPNREGLN